MKYWNKAHISKVYEALSAIADKRFKFIDESTLRTFSSSGNKHYETKFNINNKLFMSNDNTAYYTDSVSYPMVIVLLQKGIVPYDMQIAKLLAGIKWKDINQKYNNNYDKAIEHVLAELLEKGVDIGKIKIEVDKIYKEVIGLGLGVLGEKTLPPSGY